MKVIILASSLQGFASHALPILADYGVDICQVIHSQGVISNKQKHYKKKLKKTLQIGVFGALNGIRMRDWYTTDVQRYHPTQPLNLLCQTYQIPFAQTPSINSPETIALFKASQADLGLSLGNGYIAKKVFTLPTFGMLNIHHEVLPDYQNAQSILWQIYNGSRNTGYTIHKINEKIDQGDILYQEVVPIDFRDTLADTVTYNYAKLFELSSHGLAKVLTHFDEYNAKAFAQGKGQSYTTPSLSQFLQILYQFHTLKRQSSPNPPS